LINVAAAPPEMKMRTLFAEGFGVAGGAIGTLVGTKMAILGAAGVATMFGLCIGPMGMFILVLILASASGIYFSNKFKKLGGGIYDIGSHFGNGKLIYSPNQLIESF
jgi:hypothetical protein